MTPSAKWRRGIVKRERDVESASMGAFEPRQLREKKSTLTQIEARMWIRMRQLSSCPLGQLSRTPRCTCPESEAGAGTHPLWHSTYWGQEYQHKWEKQCFSQSGPWKCAANANSRGCSRPTEAERVGMGIATAVLASTLGCVNPWCRLLLLLCPFSWYCHCYVFWEIPLSRFQTF